MFTGIVAQVGRVEAITTTDSGARLLIGCGSLLRSGAAGDSVAVNGVCLTVVEIRPASFAVELVNETLQRTSLGALRVGDAVDLELPLPASGRFDGHIVQGHVDGVGTVTEIVEDGVGRRMRVALPAGLSRYVAEKGSIAVDGVSLTVTERTRDGFEVALIPHTLTATVLGERAPGDSVNIEVDVVAKYVERLLEERT